MELRETPDGVLVPINAHAAARRDSIKGIHNGRLKVEVTAAPEKGKANRAILKLLSKQLRLKSHQLKMVHGATSSEKTCLAIGISANDLRERIDAIALEHH